MSNDRKLTVKRLIIFLVISFIPFWVIVPIMWAYYGEPIYASENEALAVPISLLGSFGMMIPSCANIITRLVTKEGFHNTYLGLNCKGRMGYYIASVAVKLAESILCALLLWLILLGGMSFSDAFPGIDMKNSALFLLQLAASVILFFPAFGEEWGWRGYMMPKLLELMPKPAAVAVGGIIWGLWHAPLTVAGHNYGVDYPGYPIMGIVYMCIMCTLMNAFLTLITEKTHSIYPAAFCHSVNNNLQVSVLFVLFGSEQAADRIANATNAEMFPVYFGLMGVVAVVSMIMYMKPETASIDN